MLTDFERYNDSDNLVQLKVKHKHRDDFSDDNKYYPLFSNITDKIGVIAEHSQLNENEKWLQFALFKSDDKYYFFDVRKNAAELRQYVDDCKFICPYCGGDLFMVASHIRNGCQKKIPTHLRHKQSDDELVQSCIFNTGNKNYKDMRNEFFSGESYKHKSLKLRLYKLAKAGKLELLIPSAYDIVENLVSYEAKANFQLKPVRIVDALVETRVLKKDEVSDGYQPDLVLISEDGEYIFCEVTVSSGKTVEQYYTIWDRLQTPVIEFKYNENREMTQILNMMDAVKQMNFLEDELSEHEELFVFNSATMRFLYSPIIDSARKEYHTKRTILADKLKADYEAALSAKRLIIKQRDSRKEFWAKLMALIDWYYNKTNFKVRYDRYNKKWVDSSGKELWLEWNHLNYNDVILNLKLPKIVWKMLSTNGIIYNRGYFESK